jgi:hypothetical protein
MKKLVLVVMAIAIILTTSPNVKGDETITDGEEMCSVGFDNSMKVTIPCDLLPVSRGYLNHLEKKVQELERRIYELEKDRNCSKSVRFN